MPNDADALDDHSRIEALLYYLNLMAGRGFTGSLTVWMYDGRISRGSLQRLRRHLRNAGIPVEQENAHAETAQV